MAEIVLIHGIAQEQREPSQLEAEWIPALAAGIKKAGFQELETKIRRREVSIAMAYYGDLFRRPGAQGAIDDAAFEELLSVEMLEWADRKLSSRMRQWASEICESPSCAGSLWHEERR